MVRSYTSEITCTDGIYIRQRFPSACPVALDGQHLWTEGQVIVIVLVTTEGSNCVLYTPWFLRKRLHYWGVVAESAKGLAGTWPSYCSDPASSVEPRPVSSRHPSPLVSPAPRLPPTWLGGNAQPQTQWRSSCSGTSRASRYRYLSSGCRYCDFWHSCCDCTVFAEPWSLASVAGCFVCNLTSPALSTWWRNSACVQCPRTRTPTRKITCV